MTKKASSRREFIKIVGASTVALAGAGGCLLSSCCGAHSNCRNYKVFSQGSIGTMKLKNRLVKASSATGATLDDGSFLDAGYDMYRDWAKGGVGLLLSGHMTVAAIPEGTFHHNLTRADDDRFLPQLAKIAAAVHGSAADCKIVAQINHVGPKASKQSVGPSEIGWPPKEGAPPSETPHALTESEVGEIVERFVAAANRAKQAGFDGVEIHCAHGFLVNSFLSPLTNKRTDKYGGSVENRVRILAEIADGIRTSVGVDFPILAKVNCVDPDPENGVNIDNFPVLANEMVKTGIDALELSGADTCRTGLIETEDQSYYETYANRLDLNIPVMITGGNKNLDVIETICQNGKVDFFGLARPLIRNANLPNHWFEKTGDVQSTCISCNACLGALMERKVVTCQLLENGTQT